LAVDGAQGHCARASVTGAKARAATTAAALRALSQSQGARARSGSPGNGTTYRERCNLALGAVIPRRGRPIRQIYMLPPPPVPDSTPLP